MMPAMIVNAGSAVASMETASPWMTFVPWPDSDALATDFTGPYFVRYSIR
jgi:hypothetical protein